MPNVITQKSRERDWRSGLYLGHQFIKGSKRFGDKRCEVCGSWFSWKDSDKERFIQDGNIEVSYSRSEKYVIAHLPNGQPVYRQNPKGIINWEPRWCLKTKLCRDYVYSLKRSENIHRIKRQDQSSRMLQLFKKLMARRVIV